MNKINEIQATIEFELEKSDTLILSKETDSLEIFVRIHLKNNSNKRYYCIVTTFPFVSYLEILDIKGEIITDFVSSELGIINRIRYLGDDPNENDFRKKLIVGEILPDSTIINWHSRILKKENLIRIFDLNQKYIFRSNSTNRCYFLEKGEYKVQFIYPEYFKGYYKIAKIYRDVAGDFQSDIESKGYTLFKNSIKSNVLTIIVK